MLGGLSFGWLVSLGECSLPVYLQVLLFSFAYASVPVTDSDDRRHSRWVGRASLFSRVFSSDRRRGCAAAWWGRVVLVLFLTPNGTLLVRKLINWVSLSSPIESEVTGLLKHGMMGMYVSCAGGYYAEVSPLALRGITTVIRQPS